MRLHSWTGRLVVLVGLSFVIDFLASKQHALLASGYCVASHWAIPGDCRLSIKLFEVRLRNRVQPLYRTGRICREASMQTLP